MNRGARQIGPFLAAACAVAQLASEARGAMPQWLPDAGSYISNEAIRYASSAPSDAVARLQQGIDAGRTELAFDAATGYLKSVLQMFDVPVASQLLVFSKTSFRRDLISTPHPRAIYFGPSVYVAWVPGAPQLEVASVDPHLGAVFYTLKQEKMVRPTFQREISRCLQCHESASQTSGVPGFIMKSVLPDLSGEPILSSGTYVTTDRSPLKERWGGWYVTGTTGGQFHMGNLTAQDTAEVPRRAIDERLISDVYFTHHSDVVGLMVFAHQKHVQNLITRLNYLTRMALHFDRMRNIELGREGDFVPSSTSSLIGREGEPLVEAMLFVGEAALTDTVTGTSGFADAFARVGPRDKTGRSLRDFDLAARLFRYPCSYLIYSESFDALPAPAKDYVYGRLWAVLSGEDQSAAFRHLTPVDRAAIREILLETKPDFAVWPAAHVHAATLTRSR
jgi:hypothetical protein